ncbi:MAG: uncharacterized protein JWM21_4695 [Acidobacteria bacterium]|nr:uncharacterized protein [Acidobacteriota bacterium]
MFRLSKTNCQSRQFDIKVLRPLTLSCVLSFCGVLLLCIAFVTPRHTGPGVAAAKPHLSPTSALERQKLLEPSRLVDSKAGAAIEENYGRLPLSFEVNSGQANSEVKYYTRGAGYGFFLTADTAVLALSRPQAESSSHRKHPRPAALRETDVLRMKLIGADSGAGAAGTDELPGKANYFTGSDPEKWRTNIRTYARVHYQNIYPGIDLVYYGDQHQLEYDFVVSPGVDPAAIRLSFGGARAVKINSQGDLIIKQRNASFIQRKPYVYQQVGAAKQSVQARYFINKDNEVGFAVEGYDTGKALVIDPVLNYSTYIGGSMSDDCTGIVVDSAGNAFLTGYTFSTDFPITPDAFQSKPGSSPNAPVKDAFIMKLNAAGNGVVYSTYLGGNTSGATGQRASNGYEEGRGIAIDGAGNAYITGWTASFNFPTTPGAWQTALAAAPGFGFVANDAFVSKIGPNGDTLVYSTYLGGQGNDEAYAIALDANNNAYVTGTTDSTNFPVTSGVRQPTNAGNQDAFVTKLNATGTALVFSTYLGGPGPDWANDLAVDTDTNIYVAGITYGPDAPVSPGAFPTTPGAFRVGSSGMSDAFITKLNSNGSNLIYSTYLGGIGHDSCEGLALDSAGNVFATGITESDNFPVTPGAYRTFLNGARYTLDMFVTKLDPAGSQLVYSTYVGSEYGLTDVGRAIAINANGEAYVTGTTSSGHFPTTPDAVQRTVSDIDNLVVFKLNASGSDLVFSTYLGGNGTDVSRAIAVDEAGAIYVAGFTYSTDFPVTPGAFRTFSTADYFNQGGFVAKIGVQQQNVNTISGRIADANNNGIGNVMVKLTGSLTGSQWTDPQGNYSFGNVPAGGNYTVTPASPYYDFNPPSQSFTNLSLNQTAFFIASVRHFKISGQILNTDGSAASGALLLLTGAQTANTQTDSDGRYTFNDLPAVGAYTVRPTKTHFFFSPFSASFTSLPGDQTANFTAVLYYVIYGRVVNASNGAGLPGIRVNISGSQSGFVTTDNNGNYSLSPLIPGGSFVVSPASSDYTFTPVSKTVSNLSDDQTVDFSGSALFGNLRVRIVDQAGQGLSGVTVNLSGPFTSSGVSDTLGNLTFFHLRKGVTHQLSAVLAGYSFTPQSSNVTIVADETTTAFFAQLNQLRPFTSGNLLATAGKILTEYSHSGAAVQSVIVPFPTGTPQFGYYLGDVVVDQSGEAEIYNGPADASYLTGYGMSQGLWRHHAYPGWNPWSIYNQQEGIAGFGNYIYVTDKTISDPGSSQTQGIIRINLTDSSFQRFAADLTFCHLTVGQDALLYGIVGTTSGSQIKAYDPATLALVKTINLAGAENVRHLAVDHAGEIYATSFQVFHFSSTGAFVKSFYLPEIPTDIEISNSGEIAAAASGKVYFIDEALNVTSSFTAAAGAGYLAFTNTVPPPLTSIKFAAPSYTVSEGARSIAVTVIREGDISTAGSIDYATSNGTARQSRDYTAATGTLTFAPGVTSKTFTVLVTDNAYVDGDRTVNLTLSAAKGAALVAPGAAVLSISDNDTAPPANSPADDAQFFVRQHYADFLSRNADTNGLNFWVGEITQCGSDPICLHNKRVDVSNAFFYELEFQQTGSFVYRLYRAAFGNDQPFPNSNPDPNHPGEEKKVLAYDAFVADRARVVGGSQLAQAQLDLANAFVLRGEFLAKYPATLDGPAFVDSILSAIRSDIGADLTSQRQGLIDLFNSGGRGAVVYRLADDNLSTNPINNRAFIDAEYNRAFVVTQYFGYLRRNPDIAGLLFWLGQVNGAPLRDVARQHAMVCSFITSSEYQQRFSSIVTHNNSECPQ